MEHKEVTLADIDVLKERVRRRQARLRNGGEDITAAEVGVIITDWYESLERP